MFFDSAIDLNLREHNCKILQLCDFDCGFDNNEWKNWIPLFYGDYEGYFMILTECGKLTL